MSKLKITLLILGCIVFSNMNGQNLDKHKWENRILIIETSDELSPKYQRQVDEFIGSSEAFAERKLVLYQFVGDKYLMTDYQEEENSSDWKSAAENLNTQEDFRVLLIGLDGGVKLERKEVLEKSELFKIIDAMFMRRQEIRTKQ